MNGVRPTAAVPDGYELLGFRSGFMELVGPLFTLQTDELFRIGFACEPRHCNARGGLHGGMLAAFADLVLTCGAIYHGRLETGVITVNLSTDFLSSATSGDWLDGTAKVLRVTGSMVFAEAAIHVGDRQVVRASGVLKLGRPATHLWIRRNQPQTA